VWLIPTLGGQGADLKYTASRSHLNLSYTKKSALPAFSFNRDTVLIPDDSVPKITLPAGTIQVAKNDARHPNTLIKILGCSSYNHSEFVGPRSEKMNWKGLFQAKGGFYVADTKLIVKREHSELDENEKQKTGWRVTCGNKDRNLILINGVYRILNGPVKKALLHSKLYYAGQKLNFDYYGVTYTLYTRGFKRNGKIYNYKLFLFAKVKGHYFNQLLVALPPDDSFGGNGDMSTDVEIDFAGDLDGDKIPDFIITESGNSFGFTSLYLSRPAGKRAILQKVSFYGDTD
jgi:hypothetical protein